MALKPLNINYANLLGRPLINSITHTWPSEQRHLMTVQFTPFPLLSTLRHLVSFLFLVYFASKKIFFQNFFHWILCLELEWVSIFSTLSLLNSLFWFTNFRGLSLYKSNDVIGSLQKNIDPTFTRRVYLVVINIFELLYVAKIYCNYLERVKSLIIFFVNPPKNILLRMNQTFYFLWIKSHKHFEFEFIHIFDISNLWRKILSHLNLYKKS